MNTGRSGLAPLVASIVPVRQQNMSESSSPVLASSVATHSALMTSLPSEPIHHRHRARSRSPPTKRELGKGVVSLFPVDRADLGSILQDDLRGRRILGLVEEIDIDKAGLDRLLRKSPADMKAENSALQLLQQEATIGSNVECADVPGERIGP